MHALPTLESLDLAGRGVLIRLDLNVPMQDGVISSDARIQAALPTIRYAMEQGARVALASHLGRPKGKVRTEDSLEPVGVRLCELLGREVLLCEDSIGDGVRGLVREARPSSVLLLENLRFHAGEEANDPEFARRLAIPFDVYINDAFGASHRAHASIVGMVRHVAHSAGGLLLHREVQALERLMDAPARPFVGIVGGAKVSDKLGVLEALIGRVDALCIGGAMAYTFLRASGVEIGDSRVEPDRLRVASEILARARAREVAVLLPSDHIAASRFAADAAPLRVLSPEMGAGQMGLDIGPETQRRFADCIAGASSLFWNGPMGVFEWPAFAAGTLAVAQAVARCPGYTVVGGGDSVAAIEAAGVTASVRHVSTGGGASLELLQFGTLPGLEALRGKFA